MLASIDSRSETLLSGHCADSFQFWRAQPPWAAMQGQRGRRCIHAPLVVWDGKRSNAVR